MMMYDKLFNFMNSFSVFVAFVLLFLVTKRGFSSPIPCKEGKFFVASVFDYFNCSVCEGQAHFTNCGLCCGSANATTTTSALSSTLNSDPTSLPNSKKSEINPWSEKFSFRENAWPLGIAFTMGSVATLVIVAIAKLVILCRSKSKKRRHPTGLTPPQQETQPGLRTSPMVIGLDNGTGTNPNK